MNDKFLYFWFNEEYNIIVSTPNFKQEDKNLFFNNEPVWIIHPQVTFLNIFEDLDILPYYELFGIYEIPSGYSENILQATDVKTIKFCTFKP